ncbi:hypothetical protein [Blastococcus sp. SYSU DS1024]
MSHEPPGIRPVGGPVERAGGHRDAAAPRVPVGRDAASTVGTA